MHIETVRVKPRQLTRTWTIEPRKIQTMPHNDIQLVPYDQFVANLIKPGADILASLTPEKVNLWHMATGVSGEAGELEDAIKKHVAYNKELDRKNVIEELGDLEFYMEGIRQALGLTRDEILAHNKDKLSKRYSGGYSDAAAHARADKAEGEV
ncbi:MazG-like pyrophosphatase [Vibrio phage EniLVp02]